MDIFRPNIARGWLNRDYACLARRVQRGGEYFTPESIVKLLVAMLKPTKGKCSIMCRLGRSVRAEGHSTYHLCRLNIFILGLDGDAAGAAPRGEDQHAHLKAWKTGCGAHETIGFGESPSVRAGASHGSRGEEDIW